MFARNPTNRVEEMEERRVRECLLVFRMAMLRTNEDGDEIVRLSQELEKRLRTRIRR
jgi:hypothetical protein